MYQYPLRGYYKVCCFCGHAFANAVGARGYIQHLTNHYYYGQVVSGWKLEQWIWFQTGQEREFLASLGQPFEYEFKEWQPSAPASM